MTELLFYTKPVALHREQHRDLRFSRLADLSFSRHVNAVPLNGIEFFETSRDLAVLFRKGGDGRYFPLALLSLDNAGHHLSGEDGRWRTRYVPAFIRRYPFALAANGALCFDEACPGFNREEGDRLVDDEGKTTPFTDGVMGFLQRYEFESKRTQEFCDALAARQLLKPFDAQVLRRGGGAVRIDGLYCLDQEGFAKLEGATLEEWFRKGWLGWAYAHLHSVGALGQLSPQGAPGT